MKFILVDRMRVCVTISTLLLASSCSKSSTPASTGSVPTSIPNSVETSTPTVRYVDIGVSNAHGIVLQDNVPAFDEPFVAEGVSSSTFNSGDIVDIRSIRRKEAPEGDIEWYEVDLRGRAMWVDGLSVHISDSDWFFDSFRTATGIPKDDRSSFYPEKNRNDEEILQGQEFYMRMAHNPNPDVRSVAYLRLLWLADATAEAIISNWEPFFAEKDASVQRETISIVYKRLDMIERDEGQKVIDKIASTVFKNDREGAEQLRKEFHERRG